jgi:NADH dehydrogenase [ubiquinone] 1 alpha subcomplex assembly factor 7
MGELKHIIQHYIRENGAIDVATFMDFCLAHPVHGYYMKRDPFGREGDFITAPEVSQLFGEMIGVWCADRWMALGKPERFHLLECGPGRGTLMKDVWRATAHIDGFHTACQVHLCETSPALQKIQQENLKHIPAIWHESLETFRADAPVIILGNEFLDALPINQAIYHDGNWYMRRIDVTGAGDFVFTRGEMMMSEFGQAQDSDIREFSSVQDDIWQIFLSMIGRAGGAILMIDYGADVDFATETLQAVKAHEFRNIFDDVGDADLTAHVAFGRLKSMASVRGFSVFGCVPQGLFLQQLPIQIRAQNLIKQNPQKEGEILKGLERLIAPDQMGNLFQVLCVQSAHISQPPLGFL